jgi:hypothetical protein
MDTTKPLIPCAACGESIWPSDLGQVFLSGKPADDGTYEGRAYHKACEPAEQLDS